METTAHCMYGRGADASQEYNTKEKDAIMHCNCNEKNNKKYFSDALMMVRVGIGSTWQRARMYRLA